MPENNALTRLPYPDAKDVRWWWVKGRSKGSSKAASEDQFDRWLAARDRENRAIGWDEGAEMVLRSEGIENAANALSNLAENGHPNPYRGDNPRGRDQETPACATCGKPSTYRLGMPTPSWCDDHGPHRGDNR